MKNNEITELLNKLATLYPESWVWKAGWETVVNNVKIRMMGSTDWGYSYYIEIDGIMAYRGGESFLFKSVIDNRIESICNTLIRYNKEVENNKVVDKVKRIIN